MRCCCRNILLPSSCGVSSAFHHVIRNANQQHTAELQSLHENNTYFNHQDMYNLVQLLHMSPCTTVCKKHRTDTSKKPVRYNQNKQDRHIAYSYATCV